MNKELKHCKSCGEIIKKKDTEGWPRYNNRKYCSLKCTYGDLKRASRGWWRYRDVEVAKAITEEEATARANQEISN